MLPGNVAVGAKFSVRDLWARKGLGEHTSSVSLVVGSHDCHMLVLTLAGNARALPHNDTL
jgi:hypothetical protein